MRDVVLRQRLEAESGDLLTTGEAAALLGSSRQHVVNLCNEGLLPYTTIGRHRRIRRRDLELARGRSEQLSRDQRRSLWLNTAVAGKLATDPRTVLRQARDNLAAMQRVHTRGQARPWLQEWEHLLEAPPERIMEVLTAQTPYSSEMRQNSPFGNVLDADERVQVLRVQEADGCRGRRRRQSVAGTGQRREVAAVRRQELDHILRAPSLDVPPVARSVTSWLLAWQRKEGGGQSTDR